jgi:hypothetical protein
VGAEDGAAEEAGLGEEQGTGNLIGIYETKNEYGKGTVKFWAKPGLAG